MVLIVFSRDCWGLKPGISYRGPTLGSERIQLSPDNQPFDHCSLGIVDEGAPEAQESKRIAHTFSFGRGFKFLLFQKSNIDTKNCPYFKGVHLFQAIIVGIKFSWVYFWENNWFHPIIIDKSSGNPIIHVGSLDQFEPFISQMLHGTYMEHLGLHVWSKIQHLGVVQHVFSMVQTSGNTKNR